MKFNFSWKVSIICSLLAALMIRAANWQWDRHLEKAEMLEHLNARLYEPILDIRSVLGRIKESPERFVNRRFRVIGEFDYSKEMVLRNRRYQKEAGVGVLTPLKVDGSEEHILVNRGFIPLAESPPDSRIKYQMNHEPMEFYALAKPSATVRFLAPKDTLPENGSWLDAWLRIDLNLISKQLPYSILPIYFERLPTTDPNELEKLSVNNDSDKDDLLFLGAKTLKAHEQIGDTTYPAPFIDKVIPPIRHLAYVYEWSFMALITVLMGLVLQFRRPGHSPH